MGDRFKLLKIFGIVFKVVAWSALVIGVIGAVGVLMTGGGPEAPRGISLVILLVSALYFVISFTVAEVIKLLLVIEEQTRKTV